MIRRINIYAGPGAGKSTFAAKIFAELKIRGCDVEHVAEYVKTWAHEGRMPQSYDQMYILGHQLHREDLALRHVQHIVTDCPLFLGPAYAQFYGFRGWRILLEMCKLFDEDFQPLNFYLDRTVPYLDKGRYQSESEGRRFDAHLRQMLDANLKDGYHVVTVEQFDETIALIEKAITH